MCRFPHLRIIHTFSNYTPSILISLSLNSATKVKLYRIDVIMENLGRYISYKQRHGQMESTWCCNFMFFFRLAVINFTITILFIFFFLVSLGCFSIVKINIQGSHSCLKFSPLASYNIKQNRNSFVKPEFISLRLINFFFKMRSLRFFHAIFLDNKETYTHNKTFFETQKTYLRI